MAWLTVPALYGMLAILFFVAWLTLSALYGMSVNEVEYFCITMHLYEGTVECKKKLT